MKKYLVLVCWPVSCINDLAVCASTSIERDYNRSRGKVLSKLFDKANVYIFTICSIHENPAELHYMYML